MGYHPIVRGYKALLEIAALLAFGLWGWTKGPGVLHYLLAALLPGTAVALWLIFGAIEPVPPKRIPRVVPGWVRLGLEVAIFILAVLALLHTGSWIGGAVYGTAVALLHLASIDRIGWLLKPG